MSLTFALHEIVSLVAAHLVADKATASAVAFARCSRSLQEPVLREVWRTLSGFAPLLMCFPPDVWELDDSRLVINRGPLRAEWTRFQQQYASKVRHFIVPSMDAIICSDALRMLQLYSHANPLLPNLLSIEWNSHQDDELPFITMFLSRSLTSFSVDVPASAGSMLSPIFMMLSTMPDITKVVVQRLNYEPSLEEASSHLILNCNPRLRTYDVDAPLSASAFRRIMQLPFLKEFWAVSPIRLPDPLPDVVFPSLQEIDVEFDGDLTWLKLLPAIQSTVLSAISVQCPRQDIMHFMEAFQLTTQGCGLHKRLRKFTLRNQNVLNITPQLLACSFSFKNLSSLSLSSNCSLECGTLEVTDDDIDLLTNAMPGLKSLAIGGRPCDVPSRITFKSLYILSRRCTRLTNLIIHFNPCSFIANANDNSRDVGLSDLKTPSYGLCSLTSIDVGKILLPRLSNMSHIMVCGLLGVFPRLEKVEHQGAAWAEIDDLIRVQRRIRAAFLKRQDAFFA